MEKISEYKVSDELRKLWSVELDIYQYYKSLCKKYGLKHFAIAGTCLGAVRHNGFIPWDDDMDFGMPFDDYMKFLEIVSKECKPPYYLQCFLTDPEHGGITVSRLRRSDTTACTKWEYDNIGAFYNQDTNYNMGIWIDIFPLCYVPDDEETQQAQKEQIMDVWKAIRGYSALKAFEEGRDNVKSEYYEYIDIYKRYSEKYSIGEMKALYTQRCGINKGPTKMLGLTAYRSFYPPLMWETKWFSDSIEMPFEDLTVPVPKYYDEFLTKCYGDWRTPVMNYACHEIYMFDADTPYKNIFGKNHD